MIQNRQGQMRPSISIRLDQEIAAPDSIAWHRSRHTVFEFPSGFQNQIVMSSERAGDVALANRRLFPTGPAPIEVMRNRPAPNVRHQGLQPNDLVPNPFRLGLGEDATG
jgi:hypothetical protein